MGLLPGQTPSPAASRPGLLPRQTTRSAGPVGRGALPGQTPARLHHPCARSALGSSGEDCSAESKHGPPQNDRRRRTSSDERVRRRAAFYVGTPWFWAHGDMEQRFVALLERAFEQINGRPSASPLDLIRAYYNLPRHRWRHTRNLQRHINLLTGVERAHFAIDDALTGGLAHTGTGGHVSFNPRYLHAVLAAIDALDPNEPASVREAREDCILAELSGTLIHELAHVALQGEAFAYLVDYYWRYFYPRNFLRRGSIGLEECCGKNLPTSWYPAELPNRGREDAAQNAICWSSIVQPADGGLRSVWNNCERGGNCAPSG